MKTITVIAILFSLLFTACESDKKIIPSGKVVKIGVLAPLSGKHKSLGYQSLLGLNAANKMQKYLDNGDEIVFEIINSHSSNESSKKAFSELTQSDVVSIVSFMSSDATLYLSREFKKKKIPIISTLATANEIGTQDNYVSQVCIDNNAQVLVASHYIKDEKFIQNVGVVYNKRSKYSSAIAHEFKKYYIGLRGNVEFFMDISTPQGLKQFEQLSKENIQMLFISTDTMLTINVLKIVEKQNSTFEILGTDGLLSGALETDSLELFEGINVVEHYAHNIDKNSNRKRLEKLLDKDGFKESSFALLSYDGYQLLLYALNSCGDYSSECISSILRNSDVIEGVSKNFTMVNSKAQRAVYIDKIVNSKLEKEVVIY